MWGMFVCDMVRAVAFAIAQGGSDDYATALRRAYAGFDEEWSDPSHAPEGHPG
jgi:hypothetical protein